MTGQPHESQNGSGDRRQRPRVRIRMACQVRSPAGDFAATLEDISRTGLMFRMEPAPGSGYTRAGELLTVDVALPRNQQVGPKRLRCRGTVVRTCETAQGIRHIALQVAHMEFRDADLAEEATGAA